MSTPIRNRIKELRTVKASDLEPHPGNWRTHPKHQRTALRAMLHDIGNATAIVAYEHEGKIRIIDGHLRADLQTEAEIPVLLLDVNAEEATRLLLTMDPLAAMAETNADNLRQLLDQHTMPPGAEELELELRKQLGRINRELDEDSEPEIPATWQVVAQCDTEEAQQALFEQLTEAGYECRLLTT
jgi:hypothetical protein